MGSHSNFQPTGVAALLKHPPTPFRFQSRGDSLVDRVLRSARSMTHWSRGAGFDPDIAVFNEYKGGLLGQIYVARYYLDADPIDCMHAENEIRFLFGKYQERS